jgi:hypothetical protein
MEGAKSFNLLRNFETSLGADRCSTVPPGTSEMVLGEGSAGMRLEVLLEGYSLGAFIECDGDADSPGAIFRGVGDFASRTSRSRSTRVSRDIVRRA